MKQRLRKRSERAPALAQAPAPSDRRSVWVSLALAALVLFIYAPVWNYGFVTFDDPEELDDVMSSRPAMLVN